MPRSVASDLVLPYFEGGQWLSGRVLDSRLRGWGLEPHWHHCIVSLSKTLILA